MRDLFHVLSLKKLSLRSAEETKRDEHLEVAHFVGLDHVHLFVTSREQRVTDEAEARAAKHVHHHERQRVRVIAVGHELLVHGDQGRGRRDEHDAVHEHVHVGPGEERHGDNFVTLLTFL